MTEEKWLTRLLGKRRSAEKGWATMGEQEWLACADPQAMLAFLKNGPVGGRKLCLFACAWWASLSTQNARREETLRRVEAGDEPWQALVEESLRHTPAYQLLYTHAELVVARRGARLLRDVVGNPFRT